MTLTGDAGKQRSSGYTALLENLHPGLHFNPILAPGTYQNISADQLHPGSLQEPLPPHTAQQ